MVAQHVNLRSATGIVCGIVMAVGLMSPTAALAVCFDDPCPRAPLPTSAHAGSGVQGAPTATLEWKFKSNSRLKSGIQFYSQTRKGHEWPSPQQMWVLDDYKEHTFRLACVRGEQICFGAWATGSNNSTSWGVGHGDKLGCSNCCHHCGDNPREMVLND
jgi:hypothetical protein